MTSEDIYRRTSHISKQISVDIHTLPNADENRGKRMKRVMVANDLRLVCGGRLT
jgi:hypothetical protein